MAKSIRWSLQTLDGKEVKVFGLTSNSPITNQDIVDRIVSLGYNPLLYKWVEIGRWTK
jgi:hypothetical protein